MKNHKINTLREWHEASESIPEQHGNGFPWGFVAMVLILGIVAAVCILGTV